MWRLSAGNASVATLNSSRSSLESLECVAAGHAAQGGAKIKQASTNGKPQFILKILDETEYSVYREFQELVGDTILAHVPKFAGVRAGVDKTCPERRYIRIGNLLLEHYRPKVIDIKLGVRTFVESECASEKPRPDLFKRMQEMYPTEVTSAEAEAGTVTKFRWMTVRDKITTIGNLGFRVEGVAGFPDEIRERFLTEVRLLRNLGDVVRILVEFVIAAANVCEDLTLSCGEAAHAIALRILSQLKRVRSDMETSAFVSSHEFVGSSLLLLADASGRTGVSWIDFAKTTPLPDGVKITHRNSWTMGNHEDGILTGLDNLVDAWHEVSVQLQPAEYIGKEAAPKPSMASMGSMRSGNIILPGSLKTDSQVTSPMSQATSSIKLLSMPASPGCSSTDDIETLSMLPGFLGSQELSQMEENVFDWHDHPNHSWLLPDYGQDCQLTDRDASSATVVTADRPSRLTSWGSAFRQRVTSTAASLARLVRK